MGTPWSSRFGDVVVKSSTGYGAPAAANLIVVVSTAVAWGFLLRGEAFVPH